MSHKMHLLLFIRNRWGNIVGKKIEQMNVGSKCIVGWRWIDHLDAGVYILFLSVQIVGQAIKYKQGSVTVIR